MRSRVLLYAITALVLVALAAAALLWPRLHRISAPPTVSASSATSSGASSGTTSNPQPPNTKAYQSSLYHFSLYYPDDLTVSEQPGAYGSIVVLFEDQATNQTFVIFIVPYDQPKITRQTFEMDEPSGVMNDPINITIDGASATEFLSTNPAMGASFEIWFLHGGFLYEVTAPQSLDTWLLQIMETWQFT